ncbi:MAG: phosphoribosylaminoimidazolesuccinocarboxamide synthase [Flavobacteriales bacterium]|nr:phosphoribosylaminoimidazolesuccinocarboxamide synthase [Flavobacteriales bacterium]
MIHCKAIKDSHFEFTGQTNVYHGKVRDVYSIGNDLLVMVASDRISAFDVILPEPIPFKGQVLNQIAEHMLDSTNHICPNWKINTPDPNVTIGLRCEPFKVEMVVRGYLTGHAWRIYKSGGRTLCGVSLPDGLKEHDKLPHPIITPTTKANEGHDEDISAAEIIRQEIVPEEDYRMLEKYSFDLYAEGTNIAARRGLILVDTKYEFGVHNGEILLMDEIHTPDSSRYFYAEGYEKRQVNGEGQRQLSKEFVREWLIENNFMGKEGQQVPEMPQEFVDLVSNRYIELYENVVGEKFKYQTYTGVEERIRKAVEVALARLR